MKRVAIIINGIEGLQGSSYIIKINFLRMQAATRSLNMIFKHLASLVSFVFIFHGLCPNSSCHSPDHAVFSIHSITKEKRKIRSKLVNIHSTAEIIFNIGKSICQGKCKLRDRIGSCLCNMISADTYAVKIPYLI